MNAECGLNIAFIGKDRQIRSEALFLLLCQFSESQIIERRNVGDQGVILCMRKLTCKGARILYLNLRHPGAARFHLAPI